MNQQEECEKHLQEKSSCHSLNYADGIISTLRESLVFLDSTLCVKSANSWFYQTFAITPEETENRFIYELGNGQWDIPELRELLEEILPNNQHVDDFEVAHDFPTIGRKIMQINARRLYNEAEQTETILLAIDDTTERREREQQLENSEARYRRLFEAAQDAILILDADSGDIIDANPFVQNLLGYSWEELVGKQLWQIGLFKDIEENKSALRDLQKKGYIRYSDLPLETKDNRTIEVEFVSNVYSVGGRNVIQCNIRDITARARLERQMKKQALELADLHRRKDEFLAMLSHELRNPLAAIYGAMHIIRLQDGENSVQRKARAVLERQVGQLSHLVNDMLEVSRVITGRISLKRVPLDLRRVVEHAITTSRPLIDTRKQRFTVTLPDEPVWLDADAARLEQVFVNLLDNAAKFTDEGGDIWLSVEKEDADASISRAAKPYALVRVRDSGIGVPHELLPRIFDLFSQAERTLDRSQGGLGIGLSLVQKLVELHGGTVSAVSAGIGQGSEFIARLPLAESQQVQKDVPVGREPTIVNHYSTRVLVVDDNADIADTIALLLEMSGHDVHTAYSGQSAVDEAATYDPGVVLLDIGMPDMDGYEVARRLRRHPKTSNAWLVAFTGYGQITDRKRALDAGFDHHLVKPIEPEKLEELMTTLSKQPRVARNVAAMV